MHYDPLSPTARIEKANILAERIIVNALQSERGDIIRAMNAAGLEKMINAVFHAVQNKLTVKAWIEYGYKLDSVIEEEVGAFFEIDGKLQYLEVMGESFIDFPGIGECIKPVIQQFEMGVRDMRCDLYSLADRLEIAGILTNDEIIDALRGEQGDAIRAMNYAKFKRMWKLVFSLYYHDLAKEAAADFEQACTDYDAERDGIENDPRKKFKPKTKLEIDQEIKAYFEEQGTIH